MPQQAPQKRSYRNLSRRPGLTGFRVKVQETDLFIQARDNLENQARELILACRGPLEAYIADHPDFGRALAPYLLTGPAPALVREMAQAGRLAGTGPMSAVAGAVAQSVGLGLLEFTGEVVVENGGDVFFQTKGPLTLGLCAGGSPLSYKVGVKVDGKGGPMGVCTSSATVGHSLSLGRADAALVVAPSAALADAVATATGNRVQKSKDLAGAVEFALSVPGVTGALCVLHDKLAAAGDLELVEWGG